MNSFDDALHRVIARHLNRAVPIRTSSALSNDPDLTIGIATIKIVTEEHIQAIAYGSFGSPPTVVVRLNPIGRDVSDLLPFANFLAATANRAQAENGSVRIWIPHSVTLEALDILGHRYWRNQTAPDEIVHMGGICRIIAHEATFTGQQLIADASALLKNHVVTGLAPIEEGHLGAALAWLESGIRDPLAEARERIRLPASGVLPNTPDRPLDDRVDRLRKEAKGSGERRRKVLEAEIEDILRDSVLREWQLLVKARQAFRDLRLPSLGLEELVKESRERVNYALEHGHFPARRPDKLATLLAQRESSLEKTELSAVVADPLLREHAIRAGGVVRGVVTAVHQPRRSFTPCNIQIDSIQDVIRFRIDDKIQVIDSKVQGIVREIHSLPSGGTRVSIEVTAGVRRKDLLQIGVSLELSRLGYGFVNYPAFKLIGERKPWIFFEDSAPALVARTPLKQAALIIANKARRP